VELNKKGIWEWDIYGLRGGAFITKKVAVSYGNMAGLQG